MSKLSADNLFQLDDISQSIEQKLNSASANAHDKIRIGRDALLQDINSNIDTLSNITPLGKGASKTKK